MSPPPTFVRWYQGNIAAAPSTWASDGRLAVDVACGLPARALKQILRKPRANSGWRTSPIEPAAITSALNRYLSDAHDRAVISASLTPDAYGNSIVREVSTLTQPGTRATFNDIPLQWILANVPYDYLMLSTAGAFMAFQAHRLVALLMPISSPTVKAVNPQSIPKPKPEESEIL